MKKIFTLSAALLLTVAMFAADRRPMVTLSGVKKYTVVIDGRQYRPDGSTIDIYNLFNGQHDIRVYKTKGQTIVNPRKLVASSSFRLRDNDVQITIDRFGQIAMTQSRLDRFHDDHDRGYDRGDHDNGQWGDHDRRF